MLERFHDNLAQGEQASKQTATSAQQLTAVVGDLNTGSQQLAPGSEELSSGSQEHASSLDETAPFAWSR